MAATERRGLRPCALVAGPPALLTSSNTSHPVPLIFHTAWNNRGWASRSPSSTGPAVGGASSHAAPPSSFAGPAWHTTLFAVFSRGSSSAPGLEHAAFASVTLASVRGGALLARAPPAAPPAAASPAPPEASASAAPSELGAASASVGSGSAGWASRRPQPLFSLARAGLGAGGSDDVALDGAQADAVVAGLIGAGGGGEEGEEDGEAAAERALERIRCGFCRRRVGSSAAGGPVLLCDGCHRPFHGACCRYRGVSTRRGERGTWHHCGECAESAAAWRQRAAEGGPAPAGSGRSWELLPTSAVGLPAGRKAEVTEGLRQAASLLASEYGPQVVDAVLDSDYAVLVRDVGQTPVAAAGLDVYGRDVVVLDLMAATEGGAGEQAHVGALLDSLDGWLREAHVRSWVAVLPSGSDGAEQRAQQRRFRERGFGALGWRAAAAWGAELPGFPEGPGWVRRAGADVLLVKRLEGGRGKGEGKEGEGAGEAQAGSRGRAGRVREVVGGAARGLWGGVAGAARGVIGYVTLGAASTSGRAASGSGVRAPLRWTPQQSRQLRCRAVDTPKKVDPQRTSISPLDSIAMKTIEDLDKDYCDEFVCTSSPAVEQTVRSMARELTRGRYTTTALYQTNVTYNDGFRSFTGPQGYLRQRWIADRVLNAKGTVLKMRMSNRDTSEIVWRLTGTLAFGGLPLDITATTTCEHNLLTGRIEIQTERWDLSKCSPPAAALATASRAAWSARQWLLDAKEGLHSEHHKDNDTNHLGGGENMPKDPTRFFLNGPSDNAQSELFAIGFLLSLAYLAFKLFGELQTLQ
ncbi:hypothetical protein HYH03_006265 [Edaphochlamys debaryana]|uniref:Zinc finger PHD-type domain-containing protein n=1 Tax=Edaphochlamys debaryana TaxID=47281 RepID=A0A835YB54_9CHLO|nr:hypothetical protein HYH03_006265 [Edaphochlamys debaryana]|eukprot:KAG2495665.1 hypothetical protein HYH03_006265 [Edaphochlamys debaryana]